MNNGWSVALLVLAAPAWCANLLQNPGFEQGQTGQPPVHWQGLNLAPTPQPPATTALFQRRIDAFRGGAASAGHLNFDAPQGGNPDEAVLYQQVSLPPGQEIVLSVWRKTFSGNGAEPLEWHELGLGVDPGGGTDWNAAGVVRLVQHPTRHNEPWTLMSLASVSAGEQVTFFLYSRMAAANQAWWGHYFDDAWLEAPALNPTPTPTSCPGGDIDLDLVCDLNELPNSAILPNDGRSNRILADSDGDGLTDGEEDANRNGLWDPGETRTRNADSDGDGYEDGLEVWRGSDPLTPDPGFVDADGDGLSADLDPNDANPDVDGDRYSDLYELVMLQDMAAVTDPARHPWLGDVNGDGAVGNLDALVIQALFLGLVNPASPVFHPRPGFLGFRKSDPTRDGQSGNLDALAVQAFFLQQLATLPLRL